MFEKEAKEYENKYWDSLVDSDDKEMLGEAFKDGAEFGYNKAKKEFEALIEKMKCCTNCEFLFRDGNCYYDKECKNKDHWKLTR